MDTTEQPQSRCALCLELAQLKNSHILPAFVFRWLKDTSVTGYLRAGENPRKRVQDGLKMPLLCARCEARFSGWETAFANEIFHPYNADEGLSARYGNWMLKFCVSLSWRTLKYFLIRTGLKDWTDIQRAEADKALERWRGFIFGEVPHPGPYEQHILPLSALKRSSISDLPNNMNRYLMRGVEIDVARGEIPAFTFAKMGRFAVFGIIVPTKRRWEGSRLRVNTGFIKPSKYVLPYEVADYLMDRARKSAKLRDAIPSHQLDKIEADYMRDPERVIGTDEFAAVLQDGQMFGMDAVIRKR